MTTKNPEAIAICLNCYKIKFHQKNTAVPRSVENVFGIKTLMPIMKEFTKSIDLKTAFNNKAGDRILYLKEILKASISESFFAGILMKGHNGPQTSIDEIVSGEIKNIGTVSSEQYHCLPYFFLIYFDDKKADELIFIAQSYRQFGFKEVFEECFKTFTASQSADTTVQFNTLSVASLFEKNINEGLISKLKFIKHGLIKGADSIIEGDKFNEDNYEMEFAIKSKRGFWNLKKHLRYDDASFIEQVQIDGFEYNEVYADVTVAGRKRVMNISKPSEFSASYDITHDVNIDAKTKLPDFNDVLSQSIDVLKNDLIPYV